MTEQNEMVFNETLSFKVKLPVTTSHDDILKALSPPVMPLTTIYSYIVRTEFVDDVLTSWLITLNVSTIDRYNTISTFSMANRVADYLSTNTDTVADVICYGQGPLDVMVEAAQPLLRSLAANATSKWSQYGEYDDFLQIGNLVVCTLYNHGYYLHKSLISRAFWNDVHKMTIKRNRIQEESLDRETDDGVLVIETISDGSLENRDQQEQREEDLQILDQMRDVVIATIGVAQYKQLLFEYTNQMTTTWSRNKLQWLKAKMFEAGLTFRSFHKE